jgi:HPt (histidine-containing phosphotransfer) domain-containing protein
MNDFIAKPIEGKVLFSVIKQWLPKEKIHKTEPGAKAKKAEAVTAGSEKLQRLEATGALDVKYGMGIMGTEKLYWKVLRDYYDVIDTKAARLQEAFAGTDWSAYGIEAHALKSSSKMIGATDLSKLAETMEMAAKNGNVETIVEKHEELLRKYLWYKKALAHFVLEEEEKPESRKAWASVNDLREIFHTLKQAFDELDMDAMESVVEQLSKYRFNQDETELYEQLKEAISNLDVDSGELLLSQWELLLDEE